MKACVNFGRTSMCSCDEEIDIQVRNCSSYLVYNLNATSKCPQRYCFGNIFILLFVHFWYPYLCICLYSLQIIRIISSVFISFLKRKLGKLRCCCNRLVLTLIYLTSQFIKTTFFVINIFWTIYTISHSKTELH